MDKEFAPYEQAIALKELGFDEPCLRAYRSTDSEQDLMSLSTWQNFTVHDNHDGFAAAPLYQQAFRWFRKKHNLYTWVSPRTECTGKVVYIPHGRTLPDTTKGGFIVDIIPYSIYNTHEEAELECLKKLIEIVKTR